MSNPDTRGTPPIKTLYLLEALIHNHWRLITTFTSKKRAAKSCYQATKTAKYPHRVVRYACSGIVRED